MKFKEYHGLSYEGASREGFKLIQKAARDGDWCSIVERLAELRSIMNLEFSKAW